MALAMLLPLLSVAQAPYSGVAIPAPRLRREVVRIDPVEAQMVQNGALTMVPKGPLVTSNADGLFEGVRSGYLRIVTQSATARVALLEAAGHSMVYVNGEPRPGDPYSYGTLSLPVKLKAGENEFLFRVDRGRLRFVLKDSTPEVRIETRDTTLPDFIVGENKPQWGGFIVRNATDQWQKSLTIEAEAAGEKLQTKLDLVGPMTIRKVPVLLPPSKTGEVTLRLLDGGKELPNATVTIKLRVRTPVESHRRTFISRMDGSVQYYGVQPSSKMRPGQALFLSLHGASVEAQGQAEAYGQKDWGHLIAATNRRPYGFDWEEMGRKDALEVLGHARKLYGTDPQQTYLTGHSMGGHGTWQVGVLFPSLFGAIGPSAGWVSFFSYANGPSGPATDPVEQIVRAGALSSDTIALSRNYGAYPVYAIHGDADDNVPVTEARRMRDELKPWHPNFTLFEEKGAGHWWDNDPAPGADCVDWAPLFKLFKSVRVPKVSEVNRIDFSTPNPGISSKHFWVEVLQVESPLANGRVELTREKGRIAGKTTNIRTLRLTDLGRVESIVLDGQTLTKPAGTQTVMLQRQGRTWSPITQLNPSEKSPRRSGPFKDVYDHRVAFIASTGGTAAENAWSYAKARFDAESLLYRGNGSATVALDTDRKVWADRTRNVILYGNRNSNRAWDALVPASLLDLKPNQVTVGSKSRTSNDLALVGAVPRKGSNFAMVGIVGGTGAAGSRLTDRMPFFTSGAAFPDWMVASPKLLSDGTSGLIGAGFFSNQWTEEGGVSQWRTP